MLFNDKQICGITTELLVAQKFIELGYIDSLKGSENGRTQFINEKVIYKYFLKNNKLSLPGT